jgi:hypothetical protein
MKHSTLFVSPSTREGSQFAYPNHNRMQLLRSIVKIMGHRFTPGVGHWEDGKEESLVIHVPSDRVMRDAAKLGRYVTQKAVMWFTPGEGPDKLHVVHYSSDDALRSRGIQYMTRSGNKHYIMDYGGSLGGNLQGLDVHTSPGTIHELGGKTRAEADKAYRSALQ